MRRRIPTAVLCVSVIFGLGSVVLTYPHSDWPALLMINLWIILVALIGWLVSTRVPGNAVGPLMLAIGCGATLGFASSAYADFVFERGHTGLPLGYLAVWLGTWLTVPSLGLFTLVFSRFPNGSHLSPRWRVVEWVAIVGFVLASTAVALRPGPTDGTPSVDNPLGTESLDGVAAFFEGVGGFIMGWVVIATIVSLFIRYRRSEGAQRQQLKLLALSAAAFPVIFLLGNFVGSLEEGEDDWLSFLVVMSGLYLVPISIGVAITRYRLYDIGVIVNRALVYVALTAVVVGFYLGSVVGLQLLLDPVTQDSDLAVAASTLAAAALVRPLRSRLQSFIDRRFYRRKYDAAQTLAGLSQRLRDEVDLSIVGGDVVGVVRETMQPAHVTLWLKQPEATK